MKSITSFKRILSTTGKQIKRSGWLSWASMLVMALAFFIAIIFTIIAYTSNLFLQSIENEPHVYVFFNVGVDEADVLALKEEWEGISEIERVEYTTEAGAIDEFQTAQERTNPQIADSIRANVLPASLGIRLFRIQDADKIIDLVNTEQADNEDIFEVAFSKQTIDTIRSLFHWLRIGGGVIMGLLLIVIFAFTLLTVEFRTFSRAEEIGIMQLVGGSLWFIRAPFVFEGAFYGLVGSLISSTLIYGLTYWVFVVNKSSGAVSFLLNFFGDLKWPVLTNTHLAMAFAAVILSGLIIGGLNSYIAIKRYIN